MGSGEELSAFATVHRAPTTPESVSANSTDSSTALSEALLVAPHQNAFWALSGDSGTLFHTPNNVAALGSDILSISLSRDEVEVTVVGLFSLWVRQGRVSLWGAILQASSSQYHVYVPVSDAVPSITARSDSAEVVVCPNECGLGFLGDIFPHYVGLWEPTILGGTSSYHVLGYPSEGTQDVSKELRRLDLEHWLPPIRALLHQERSTTPKVLVSGAKGTGKSTCCRVLTNSMLTMTTTESAGAIRVFPDGVILLDIDPGQPELTAPGMITLAHIRTPLLGPSFANLVVPGIGGNSTLRMHYLGACTPQESPSHYQECVVDLLSLYREYEHMPLIINTSGWNIGSGKSLLLSAVQGIGLTDVVHIGDTQPVAMQSVVPTGVGEKHIVLTQLISQPYRAPLTSGRDLREIQLQAYLHARGHVNGRVLWDRLPVATLCQTLPAASEGPREIIMVVMLGEEVGPDYILDALNGSVVAVVIIKHDSPLYALPIEGEQGHNFAREGMYINHTPFDHFPYLVYGDQGANPLEARSTECMGLGVITAVRPERKELCISSPLPASSIRSEMAKGYKIVCVAAPQQGLWST